jgi:hypothetical protein
MPTFTSGPYPRLLAVRFGFVRWGLLGVLLIALVAAGCGGGGALSLDPVASAASQTLDKQTGRFQLNAAVKLPFAGRATVTAEGKFSAPEQAVAMTVNLPDFGSGTPSSLGVRFLYPVMYLHLDRAAPSGQSWFKVDLQQALRLFGVELPQLDLSGSQSPADALAWLKGSKNAKKLGAETIAGVQTTHYRGRISLVDAIARAAPKERTALQQLLRKAKEQGSDLASQFDVWVSHDGLVRRVTQKLGNAGSVTMTFSDYGLPVEIEAPPADETVDFFKLG